MIEELEKLKNQFAIELSYREYENLDQITHNMFNLIQDYINSKPVKDDTIHAIQKAKDKAEHAHKNSDLQEFIVQIDVVSLLLVHPYREVDVKENFLERIEGKEQEVKIRNWVQERKEILQQDPRFFIRLQKKIADLLKKL